MIIIWIFSLLLTSFWLSPLSGKLTLDKKQRDFVCVFLGMVFILASIPFSDSHGTFFLESEFFNFLVIKNIPSLNELMIFNSIIMFLTFFIGAQRKGWNDLALYLGGVFSLGLTEFYNFSQYSLALILIFAIFKKLPKIPYLAAFLLLQGPAIQKLARVYYGWDSFNLFLLLSLATYTLWELIKSNKISFFQITIMGLVLIGNVTSAPLMVGEISFLKVAMIPMFLILALIIMGKNNNEKYGYLLLVFNLGMCLSLATTQERYLVGALFLFVVGLVLIQEYFKKAFKNSSKNDIPLILPALMFFLPLPSSIYLKVLEMNLHTAFVTEYFFMKISIYILTGFILGKGSFKIYKAIKNEEEKRPEVLDYLTVLGAGILYVLYQYLPVHSALVSIRANTEIYSASYILIWVFVMLTVVFFSLFSAEKPQVGHYVSQFNYFITSLFSFGYRESSKIEMAVPNFKGSSMAAHGLNMKKPGFKVGFILLMSWFLVFFLGVFFV